MNGIEMKQVKKTGLYCAAKDQYVDCGRLVREHFFIGEGPRRWDISDTGLLVFAYLYRRFGPPLGEHDSYDELCAYVLTTEMEGVYLRVTPSARDIDYCISYCCDASVKQELDQMPKIIASIPWRSRPGLIGKLNRALDEAINELRRGVRVGDSFIAMLGEESCDGSPKAIPFYQNDEAVSDSNESEEPFQEVEVDGQ